MAKNAWRTEVQRSAVLAVMPVVKIEGGKVSVVAFVSRPEPVKPNAESVRLQAHELLAKSPDQLFRARAHEILRQQPQEVQSAPQLKVGDLILRPVRLLGGDCATKEILDVNFGRSEDRKSRTFKARRGWEFAPNEWVASEMNGRGVVCFSEEESPRGWTHFVVTKLGKRGTTAEVRPCKPDSGKLFSKFHEPGPVVSFKEVGHGTLSGA